MTALKTTPFHQAHQDAGAKLVDFAGWELPIHYGSQIAEHEAVRTDAGMFDVSHMLVTDVAGANAKAFFRKLIANDVAKLAFVGKALYSALLNDNGGVIDDLIVYRTNEAETQYRIVSNGATREKRHGAIPQSRTRVRRCLQSALRPWHARRTRPESHRKTPDRQT